MHIGILFAVVLLTKLKPMSFNILMSSLVMVFVLSSACSEKELAQGDPLAEVREITTKKTLFTDDMYAQYDHESFLASGMANVVVDYHDPDYGLMNAAVFYHTNKYRISKGKQALAFSAALRDAAVYHSLRMVEQGFYDHTNRRIGSMRTVVERAQYFGYPNGFVGENIDKEFFIDYRSGTNYSPRMENGHMQYYAIKGDALVPLPILTYDQLAENLLTEWINSAGHRKNMLMSEYKYLGLGLIPDFQNLDKQQIPEVLATQVFGGE